MSLLLDAFKGKQQRVPVWLMRQAGRYLPEYRALKATRTLNQMFRDPDTAAEITLQPVRLLGVDAAILFADILTLPSAMGFKVDFIDGKGPVIDNPIITAGDIKRIHRMESPAYISKTIALVNQSLSADVPLIGFAGSPFTVLTYLCPKYLRMMNENPKAFHAFMHILTVNTISYLKLQQNAGIKVYQLFDTWGGSLRQADYKEFVLPYVQQIFKSIDLPSIYYLKNCAHLMDLMDKCGADMLSVCETVSLKDVETKKGVQGNLFNGLLYADDATLIKEIRLVLKQAQAHHKKYIFNLSHGMMPDMDPAKVKLLIHEVKNFPWRKQ